jgi:hypothetical protein
MTEEATQPEPAPTGVKAVDAAFATVDGAANRVERYLKLGERYGWLPLILGLAYFQVLLPLRDGATEHVKASTEAQKETSKAVVSIEDAMNGIEDAVKTLTDGRAKTDDNAAAHVALTREIGGRVEAIGGDVQEIKAAVVPRGPRPSATSPRPYSAAGT